MTVNDVEKHGKTHAMCGVDEALEVLGRSVSRRDGEERGDLVAERGVVRVLHNGHPMKDQSEQELVSQWINRSKRSEGKREETHICMVL
jgi:hypothetical protein